jgi:hypothetical protein
MIAVSEVFKQIGTTLGAFEAYGDPLSAIVSDSENFASNIDDANKNLKETSNLLGIDKFRALSSSEEESNQDQGIDDVLVERMKKITKSLEVF